MNEIHIMRHLKHENVIKLYEVFEGEQHIYLVMDLLQGGELFDRIVNESHFEEKDSFKVIIFIILINYYTLSILFNLSYTQKTRLQPFILDL